MEVAQCERGSFLLKMTINHLKFVLLTCGESYKNCEPREELGQGTAMEDLNKVKSREKMKRVVGRAQEQA